MVSGLATQAVPPAFTGNTKLADKGFGPRNRLVNVSVHKLKITEVHGLVQRIAEERLNLKDTLPNQRRMARTREAERAGLVAYVRRALSLTAVKQQARLLLDRLRLLGDGAVEAGRRRQRAAGGGIFKGEERPGPCTPSGPQPYAPRIQKV